jgi:hypothetical protein
MTVIETVTSPAGEQIDVVDVETTILWGTAAPLIQALWNDGPFTSNNGEASRPWWEAARRRGYRSNMSALSSAFKRGMGAFVHREINGKRCYEIRLVAIPKVWFDGRLDDEKHIPLTMTERASHREVVCPLCAKQIGMNNLHRHLLGPHRQTKADASRLARMARAIAANEPDTVRASSALPALIDDEATVEPERLLNDIPAIDLMTGMLSALRRDGNVPIDALPTLQEWLASTERVLAALDG